MKTLARSEFPSYSKTFESEEHPETSELLQMVVWSKLKDRGAEEGIVTIWEDGILVSILEVQEGNYDGGNITQHHVLTEGARTLLYLYDDQFQQLLRVLEAYTTTTLPGGGEIKSRKDDSVLGDYQDHSSEKDGSFWMVRL
jgi:hypothetical protein